MKIIAGVHARVSRAAWRSTARPVHFRSPRDALAAGIGMVHQELSVVPDLTRRRERLSRQAADRAAASSTGAPWCAGAREQLAEPRHRRRSARAHGRAADRPAAADRARPRAVLGRPHRHPRRADLGAVAARGAAPVRGAARRARAAAAASSSSRTSSTTCWRSPTRSRSSATAGTSSPRRPARIDKGWLIERMIGRGHEELEESYTGAIALDSQARRAGRPRACAASAPAAPSPTSRSTSGRARCWASTASWAAARSSSPARCSARLEPTRGHHVDRRQVAAACAAPPRRAAPASPSCRRAGGSMLFHPEPVYKNMSIAMLGRIAAALAAGPRSSARSPRRHVEALSIRPPTRRHAARQPVGRQPAEGGAGQVADLRRPRCWC